MSRKQSIYHQKAEVIRRQFPGYELFQNMANVALAEYLFGAAAMLEKQTAGMTKDERKAFLKQTDLARIFEGAGISQFLLEPGDLAKYPSRGEALELFGRFAAALGRLVQAIDRTQRR